MDEKCDEVMQEEDDEEKNQPGGCWRSLRQANHIGQNQANLEHPDDTGKRVMVMCKHDM